MFVTTAVFPMRDVNERSQTNMELPWVIYEPETREPSLWNHHRWLGVPWFRCIWYDLDIKVGLCKVWVALHTFGQNTDQYLRHADWHERSVLKQTPRLSWSLWIFLFLSFCWMGQLRAFSSDMVFNKWIQKLSKLTWACSGELWGTFILLPLIE